MKPDTPNPGIAPITPENSQVESDSSKKNGEAPRPEIAPTSSAQPTQTLKPVSQQPATVSSQSTNSSDDGEGKAGTFEASISALPAEESDTIESAWVDKTNEIIDKTSADPYSEDDAQHALSRAYLKKRFGVDVK